MCLREKEVAYESRYIELWNYENLHPAYLMLNPNGVVPTLVHDGQPIINALVIMEYIEDAFSGPALMPDNAQARARMRFWTWTADDIHLAVMTATYKAFLSGPVKDLSKEDVKTLIAHIPVPDRQERWRRFANEGFSQEELDAARRKIAWGIDRIEQALGQTAMLAGDDFSLADISVMAIVHRIREIMPDLLEPAKTPQIDKWWRQLMTRPAAQAVYADNSDEVPARPKTKSISGLTSHWPYSDS